MEKLDGHASGSVKTVDEIVETTHEHEHKENIKDGDIKNVNCSTEDLRCLYLRMQAVCAL